MNTNLTANSNPLEGKLAEIKRILGIPVSDFSVIHWQSAGESCPQDATYILLKMYTEDGFICEEATYEKGQYWPLFFPNDTPFILSAIAAWSYLPYDLRLDLVGQVK